MGSGDIFTIKRAAVTPVTFTSYLLLFFSVFVLSFKAFSIVSLEPQ